MSSDESERQKEIFAFLRDGANWGSLGSPGAAVDAIETHGAMILLNGSNALKIKRAVKLAYLDFSTLDRRKSVCEREISLNQPAAPDIYRGVVAIVRRPSGELALDGDGEPVEWAVLMTRFADDALLERYAQRHGVTSEMARDLADMCAAMHAAAPVALGVDTAERLSGVVRTIEESVAAVGLNSDAMAFAEQSRVQLACARPLLDRRSVGGLVRRCHGDLHMGNVIVWNSRPVPFDAIEFDDDLATIDVLYDLAFLLMDLERHGLRVAANQVLGRYLWRTDRDLDLDGLTLLPLFLAVRAGVRAMVRADRARQVSGAEREAAIGRCRETITLANRYLAPPVPRLVAIGGLSGTGKSTLAARLAPLFGAAPGALHLRSDLERKSAAGAGETERLPPEAYRAEASAEIYRRLAYKARRALKAGHSVIVDAVFADPRERREIAAVAEDIGVPFRGIWLTAPTERLKARVAARRNDASDATPEVVDRQLTYDVGSVDWSIVDADGDAADVAGRAVSLVGADVRPPAI
jgi:aminoglycoside phosphotransferase family enzyme/predicted kinase